jgi:hypothetical protein
MKAKIELIKNGESSIGTIEYSKNPELNVNCTETGCGQMMATAHQWQPFEFDILILKHYINNSFDEIIISSEDLAFNLKNCTLNFVDFNIVFDQCIVD